MRHLINNFKSSVLTFNLSLNQNGILQAVRNGLLYMLPLILVGSFALVIMSLPIESYQTYMIQIFGENWKDIFLNLRDGTFSILSIVLVITISYSVAMTSASHTVGLSPVIVVIVSVASFFAMSGMNSGFFDISNLGVIGMFMAISVSLISSHFFILLLRIKRIRRYLYIRGANVTFNNALLSIIPASFTILLFSIINKSMTVLFGTSNFEHIISKAIIHFFTYLDGGLLQGLFFLGFIQIFWFFGMHGNNIMEPITQQLYNSMVLDQATSTIYPVLTKTFFDVYVLMGGCGTIFSLVIALFLFSKLKNNLRLSKLSILPLIFNINEMIVFGLPIVLNPIYLIPFFTVPLVTCGVAYFATISDMVPPIIKHVEWTTPILLSGYVSTGSIAGSLLQMVNLFIGVLIYMPFVKVHELIQKKQFHLNFTKLLDGYENIEENGLSTSFLKRIDDVGNIAKYLVFELEEAIYKDELKIYYQPQHYFDGEIYGLEALLRWEHPAFGFISPPLIIALAEEGGLTHQLGNHILESVFKDIRKFNREDKDNMIISINITPNQLNHKDFYHTIKKYLATYDINPEQIQLEITERASLTNSKTAVEIIHKIKETGIKLAMDDFGMGHTSLLYLKEYEFDTVKLDGSLVQEIMKNNNCKDIIRSIVHLGENIGFQVLAEYVETFEQREILNNLGCNLYQGFYYSQALPLEDILHYFTKKVPVT